MLDKYEELSKHRTIKQTLSSSHTSGAKEKKKKSVCVHFSITSQVLPIPQSITLIPKTQIIEQQVNNVTVVMPFLKLKQNCYKLSFVQNTPTILGTTEGLKNSLSPSASRFSGSFPFFGQTLGGHLLSPATTCTQTICPLTYRPGLRRPSQLQTTTFHPAFSCPSPKITFCAGAGDGTKQA